MSVDTDIYEDRMFWSLFMEWDWKTKKQNINYEVMNAWTRISAAWMQKQCCVGEKKRRCFLRLKRCGSERWVKSQREYQGCRWVNASAVNSQAIRFHWLLIWHLLIQSKDLCFRTIKTKEVICHPVFDNMKAVLQGRGRKWNEGFTAEVGLSVICIIVKM